MKVLPIPVPSADHPLPRFEQLPKHEFTMGLIAPKGAGKTTLMCRLLDFYRGYFHTILVFSPTIESDEKWDWVKGQKLLVENKPLKMWIKHQVEKSKKESEGIVDNPPPSTELEQACEEDNKFTGYIPEEHFFHDYDEDKFMEIMTEQLKLIKLLKKHGKPKFLANRLLIIFDDLVGSSLFNGKRGSYFKGINTRHRHYSASFLMVSQGYKEVPKTIRTNWTCLVVFEIGNEREVMVIYEEFAMGLNHDDWLEIYRYCTTNDHDFLFIDFQKKKRLRMMRNFEQYMIVGKDEEEVD
jgi:hypothetical protein